MVRDGTRQSFLWFPEQVGSVSLRSMTCPLVNQVRSGVSIPANHAGLKELERWPKSWGQITTTSGWSFFIRVAFGPRTNDDA